jgi:hypothetical protein
LVKEQIGEGSFGAVYGGYHIQIPNLLVAIKVEHMDVRLKAVNN